MRDLKLIERIKELTISALVSDDLLVGLLVLKGGNALGIAYDITNRGSIDIDFSMEKDFNNNEIKRLTNELDRILNNEFNRENLFVFDIVFRKKPSIIHSNVEDFWGGYELVFKVINNKLKESIGNNIEELRKRAIPIYENNSPIFSVDISRYEYVKSATKKDIKGAIVHVYTPEMLALEKLRALCQQVKDYKNIVISMTPKSRARDFYDIYNLTKHFNIDFTLDKNISLLQNIFNAKRVKTSYVNKVRNMKDFHKQSWNAVVDSVDTNEDLKEFDFYFDFVLDTFKHIK